MKTKEQLLKEIENQRFPKKLGGVYEQNNYLRLEGAEYVIDTYLEPLQKESEEFKVEILKQCEIIECEYSKLQAQNKKLIEFVERFTNKKENNDE